MPSTESSKAGLSIVGLKRLEALEQLHPQTLARAVVLGDERDADPFRGGDDCVAADRCDGARRTNAVGPERGILRDRCLISSCSARPLLTTRRPCNSSQASIPAVSSGA